MATVDNVRDRVADVMAEPDPPDAIIGCLGDDPVIGAVDPTERGPATSRWFLSTLTTSTPSTTA